ncbi:unnamed protein product, partial [Ectocarpus sp. 12 AP-2014]
MARRWGGCNRGRDTVVVDTAAAAVEVRSSTPLREGPRRGGSRRRGSGWLFRLPDRAGGRSSGIWGTKDRTAGTEATNKHTNSTNSPVEEEEVEGGGGGVQTALGSGRGLRARYFRGMQMERRKMGRQGTLACSDRNFSMFFGSFVACAVAAFFGSFRPGGSVLKKKEESVASANIQAFGGPGAYGNPFPSFAGPSGLGGGQPDGPTPDLAGPGAPEVISVDGSIVMVLKPNDLAKKKRKFKQDGANRLQVIATFDHCLTAFHAKDGKTPCLKTTDALEQNQHVMLPEAAKKVRFLRSDFKRRMDE